MADEPVRHPLDLVAPGAGAAAQEGMRILNESIQRMARETATHCADMNLYERPPRSWHLAIGGRTFSLTTYRRAH